MLLCILSLVLSVPLATGIKQTICGVVGQAVFLNPGYFGDLSKSETLWIFNHGDKNPVNIVDYFPGKSTEYPNMQFKSRLQYNTYNGSLQVQNLRPEDRGNFTFRVGVQDKSVLELIVIKPMTTTISRTCGSSVFFPGIQETERSSALMVQWQKISENIKNKSRTNIVWQSRTGSSEPDISDNYEGRIDFHLSNGSFILQNIISGDRGVYQLSIIQPEIIVQTVRLIIIDSSWKETMIVATSLIALVLSLFYHGAFLLLRWKKPNQDYKSLFVCNVLSLVFTIIALSFWISIKDDVFPAVVALCTLSFWVLAMIAVFVPKLYSLIEGVFHLSKGFPRLIGTSVIPFSIVILKEGIQQNNQGCQTYNSTWISIVSLVICCIIITGVYFAMCYSRRRNTSDEEKAETEQQHNHVLQDLNDGHLDLP